MAEAADAKRKADDEARRRADEEARKKQEEQDKRRTLEKKSLPEASAPIMGGYEVKWPVQGRTARIEWVTIPGGSLVAGVGRYPPGAKFLPPVRVKAFEMAKTEVTNAQYRACVQAGACTPPGNCIGNWVNFAGDDQPVVCVNWNEANAFAKWAGGRIPSGLEWEYAARGGGKNLKFPWGDEPISCRRAVMKEMAKTGPGGCGRKTSWPVCSKPEGNTEQGLCDMEGNVEEWTSDRIWGGTVDGYSTRGGSFKRAAEGSWNELSGSGDTTSGDDGRGFRILR